MNMGATAEIEVASAAFLDDRLGPLIEEDAKRYAPKRTSKMADTIYHNVEGETLYIISPAPYSAWVELGHRVFHPSTGLAGPDFVPEQPFLRPAIYKYRTPESPDPPANFPVAISHPGISYPTLYLYEVEKLGWRFEH